MLACMFCQVTSGESCAGAAAPINSEAMDESACRRMEFDTQLNQLKKNVRNEQRRQNRISSIPDAMWRVATAVLVMTHPATEPACLYLEQRWRHWNDHQDAARQRLQLWHSRVAATSGFDAVMQPSTASGQTALKKAQAFLQEMRLHNFVDEANRSKGIAPRTSVLINNATCQSTLSPPPLLRLTMKRKYQLQWLRRWRRRWDVGLGPLQARDTLPPVECRKKVLAQKKKHFRAFVPTQSRTGCVPRPDLCPQKRVQNMALILAPPINSLSNPGPKNGPHFGIVVFRFLLSRQALAVWRWSNFLHKNSPRGRTLVRINMDETSIRLHQAVRAGHLTTTARLLKRSARSLTSNATTSETRGMFTLIAFVCDKKDIQNILPQILIVNDKHLSKTEPAAVLRQHLEANMVLWTASKAWVTSTLMCKIVRHLNKCLKQYKNTHHFILSSDGYRAHLTKPVWRALNRARIMYHLIPAKMTWALQPCDTHVFARLKDVLRHECQVRTLETSDGRLTMSLLCAALA